MRSFRLYLLLALGACGSSGETFVTGPDGVTYQAGGAFILEGANVVDGMEWQLNRPLRLDFNHPVDPDSVGFGAIQIRALDPDAFGSPVTGVFELDASRGGRSVIFRPACPTDDALLTGGLTPGGVAYEIYLPTRQEGLTVLRDTDGRPLSNGMRRTFRTPELHGTLFLDFNDAPARAVAVDFPKGLNLFADLDPVVEIRFDQAIDGRSTNLHVDNLHLLYSEGEIGQPGEDTFPSGNRVPGELVLLDNCTEEGARVAFHITGILPPNRRLQVRTTAQFRDIGGQRHHAGRVLGEHATPSLQELYGDPSLHEGEIAFDEIQHGFGDAAILDPGASLPSPPGKVGDGFVAAQFDFPGGFISPDADFLLSRVTTAEIRTDSQVVFLDSNNTVHVIQDGVLRVDDFRIEAGSSLRGRGSNPLIIYASGEVWIEGTLDVSGNHGTVPISLQSPQFVELGALGECGGGRGGDASSIGSAETLRGDPGDGAFGVPGGGGGGGEGGFTTHTQWTSIPGVLAVLVGGGGGGGFARTPNEAVLWDRWPLLAGWTPFGVDDAGPDHVIARHPRMQGMFGITPERPEGFAIVGAEDGMRGTGGVNPIFFPAGVDTAPWGMEDAQVDPVSDAIDVLDDPDYDPAWVTGDTPTFDFGDPNLGPDGGAAGPSVFRFEPTLLHTRDDFWGTRLQSDGSILRGELLTPWAGSGGGGSGDSMTIRPVDLDGDEVLEPLAELFPVRPFVRSTGAGMQGWSNYRKGAGGGGGGGQVMIMAVGMIHLGAEGRIKANGGIGMGGESVINTDKPISGSGGGSGGHLILHSSTGLDLSAVDLGSAASPGQIADLVPAENIQAIGGRRGWAGSLLGTTAQSTTRRDGNATFALGRGGAGANGVIQIHVPDPAQDIVWHEDARPGIETYLEGSPNGIATDRVEELLALVTAPSAYALLPFFATDTMVQSHWIDTGLAEVRRGAPDDFPAYAHAELRFAGIDADGLVESVGGKVSGATTLTTGPLDAVDFQAFTLTIPRASTLLDAMYLRLPSLLVGYDIKPKASGEVSYEIVDAEYRRDDDTLVLTTSVPDSPMLFAVDPSDPVWSIERRFFRIDTGGAKDALPASTSVGFEFQGADEDPLLADTAGIPFGGPLHWTSDLTELDGARFIRYRILFDTDALDEGLTMQEMQFPGVDYVKLPVVW